MFKFLKRLFKRKPKYVVPNWEPFYEHRFPPIKFGKIFTPRKKKRIKQLRPPFPGGTFVYPIEWYDSWNQQLKDDGWTKKELKQGWRWQKAEDEFQKARR